MRSRVYSAIVLTAVLLVFIGLIIYSLNPFKTLPSISVKSAMWRLTSSGLVLRLTLATTQPVQLVAVEAGGYIYTIAYDIEPPNTTVEIPLPLDEPVETVRLHFNVGNPISTGVMLGFEKTNELRVLFGRSGMFLVGELSQRAQLIVAPTVSEPRILIVTVPNRAWEVKMGINRELPGFPAVVVDGTDLHPDNLSKYNVVVFIDVAPEPSLLDELVREGKLVVVTMYKKILGQVRLSFNGTEPVFREVQPDKADIDYLGAHCIMPAPRKVISRPQNEVLKRFASLLGTVGIEYVFAPSPFCSELLSKIYVKSDEGFPVVAKIKDKYIVSGLSIPYTLLMVLLGSFQDYEKTRIVYEDLHPFKGFHFVPLDLKYHTRFIVVVLGGGRVLLYKYVELPPVSISVSGKRATVSLGIDRDGNPVWRGFARVRIEKYSYDYTILDVVKDKEMALPSFVTFTYDPLYAYVVYVNATPVAVVADENVVVKRPDVVVYHSNVVEAFYIIVERRDSIESVLRLYVNGRPVALLDPGDRYEVRSGKPGFYQVEVRDVYGRTVYSARFEMVHFYQTPTFMLVALLMSAVGAGTYASFRRRAQREIDTVYVVFYRAPEIEKTGVLPDLVLQVVETIMGARKRAPTLEEVFDWMYRRRPMHRTIAETGLAIRELLSKRALKRYGKMLAMFGRYVPEIDDSITIVAPVERGARIDLVKHFYVHVLSRILAKFGASGTLGEIAKDIVDVDYVITVGEKVPRMILVTFAPSEKEVPVAIDRALRSLVTLRRVRQPFKLAGAVVITEPHLVPHANRIIDEILDGNDEVASKVLRDMSIYAEIRNYSKRRWLDHYALCAVPWTNLMPLLATLRFGAVRLCNKYYRTASFAYEERE